MMRLLCCSFLYSSKKEGFRSRYFAASSHKSFRPLDNPLFRLTFTCKCYSCVSKEKSIAMQVRFTARLLLSVLFPTSCFSQSTELFCNRLYHSIVVANDRLYIDGGEIRTVRTY